MQLSGLSAYVWSHQRTPSVWPGPGARAVKIPLCTAVWSASCGMPTARAVALLVLAVAFVGVKAGVQPGSLAPLSSEEGVRLCMEARPPKKQKRTKQDESEGRPLRGLLRKN